MTGAPGVAAGVHHLDASRDPTRTSLHVAPAVLRSATSTRVDR